jgi:hypothetical protein
LTIDDSLTIRGLAHCGIELMIAALRPWLIEESRMGDWRAAPQSTIVILQIAQSPILQSSIE